MGARRVALCPEGPRPQGHRLRPDWPARQAGGPRETTRPALPRRGCGERRGRGAPREQPCWGGPELSGHTAPSWQMTLRGRGWSPRHPHPVPGRQGQLWNPLALGGELCSPSPGPMAAAPTLLPPQSPVPLLWERGGWKEQAAALPPMGTPRHWAGPGSRACGLPRGTGLSQGPSRRPGPAWGGAAVRQAGP